MYRLRIEDDLDLTKIADSGQCFRWEALAGGAYRIVHRAHCVTVTPLGEGCFDFSCDEAEFRSVWREYFDLGTDYRAVRSRVRREEDPYLFDACEFGRGIRILRQDPWETLVSFIISQNRNIPAIKRSIELMCQAAGERRTDSLGGAYTLFPSPEAVLTLDDEALSACRLGYRCRYVRAAARAVVDGTLDLRALQDCGEEEALKALTALCGVGIKVASCVLLFGLHYTDAFPVDVWIRRVLAREYPQGWPMKKYSPYNGIYQQYLFFRARTQPEFK